MKMSRAELDEILELHRLWLEGDPNGRRANLSYADLSEADLSEADLRYANLSYADLSEADLSEADLRYANLSGANLRGANLRRANLRRANLHEANLSKAGLNYADIRGANIDYASWPLWCGSLGVKIDKRQAAQFAYHFCRMVCDDDEAKVMQADLLPLANQFHRVDECGIVTLEDIRGKDCIKG